MSSITIEPESLVENRPVMNLFNKTDEALFVADDSVFSLYEANGALHPEPHATRFDLSLHLQGKLPFPHLEYRLTDASPIDSQGRFWVMDVYYSGERSLRTHVDALSMTFGKGRTHSQSDIVERLVELQYSPEGITLIDTPPIQHCPDIRVYIVDTPHFNASMAPNGCMQVWTGLMLRAENEAQLAYVLAHEMAHYLRRHTLQRCQTVRNTSTALAFFSLATAAAGVGFAGDRAQLIAIGAIFAYSRDQEREADEIGIETMAKVGYEPVQASQI